jgi:branched-chain amino acid transport system ATP-binding protein
MLKIEKLNVYRGYIHANIDISFDVKKGEMVGIFGSNGAGKTTLLQSIMGLVPVKSGSINYNGSEITTFPPYKIARLGIGYVPEDRRLISEVKVEENILIPCWGKKMPQRVKFNTFEEIFPGIKKLYGKSGEFCSGGEQMLIAIFRALSSGPDFLLLDECYEGLSGVTRESWTGYLLEERKKGLSGVIAESNRAFLTWCDKLYQIERGILTPL